MKIVTHGMLASALLIGLSGAAYAQSGGATSADMGGAPLNGANGAGTGTGLGTGVTGPSAGAATVRGATAIGARGGTESGPSMSNMRANGTSLNMNPDPRAPNVSGNAFAPPR
ncbi:hypothetical protein DLM46_20030 [Paraburkholderia lacunae]|uniref:Uncharacterized protein n=1 Tax=Paraburkholderia lacunae TaxID=2211104 RepID=A0A370N650_9BURK|nr:hypothetical protein DLM46_20030 [Paraburkholderia lacunae]